jgi:integrase
MMASLIRVKGKRGISYEVQFSDGADRRPKIRLGIVSKKVAYAAKIRIEHLIAAKAAGHSVDAESARWIDGVSDALHARLAKAGLVPHRHGVRDSRQQVLTLGALIDRYISRRDRNLKPNTVRKMHQARRAMVNHFGEDRLLHSISAGVAADWREKMLETLAEATVATHIKCAKAFFGYARDSEFIASSPFDRIKAGSQKNAGRKCFVPREPIAKVLAVCPNNEWRLIIALARYGGLRVPSELQRLRWSDIDWAGNRFVVHVSKKEHLDGQQTRVVPIFPEIRPYLEEAFHLAALGSVYVVPLARQPGVNLRTPFERLLAKAGVKQWPRLFQNLRASRETELASMYPMHLVTSWIGNTKEVAMDHYLMATDEDFLRASRIPVQNPVQSQATMAVQEPSGGSGNPVWAAIGCYTNLQVPSTGIEPVTFSSGG